MDNERETAGTFSVQRMHISLPAERAGKKVPTLATRDRRPGGPGLDGICGPAGDHGSGRSAAFAADMPDAGPGHVHDDVRGGPAERAWYWRDEPLDHHGVPSPSTIRSRATRAAPRHKGLRSMVALAGLRRAHGGSRWVACHTISLQQAIGHRESQRPSGPQRPPTMW